jgi:ATP-dependent helicase/nuclease subunit B
VIGGLLVRGEIDRVDVVGAEATIRDFKSGKPKVRKPGEPPDPVIDLQLAAYSLAVRELAREGKLEAPTSAAYVYSTARHHPERSFSGPEFEELLTRGREWLGLVLKMIQEGAYPRTPDKADCKYCAFKVVCGEKAPSEVALKFSEGTVSEFVRLKMGSPPPPPGGAAAKKGAKPRHGK